MSKPFIVAEAAQGFEGSEKLVDLYVKAAIYGQADAIKFQIFRADELALPDYHYYSWFKQVELPFSVWKSAVKAAHAGNLDFYADVFGIDSFKELELIGVDGYKIHASDIKNPCLLREVAKCGKRILLSVGGCEEKEIVNALSILGKSDVVLMYGHQANPTPLGDNNLRRLWTLRQKFDLPVGFQDHTAGDSRLAFHISSVSLGLGAEIIEKHITLSRGAGLDGFISALTAEEFKEWVDLTRSCYEALGEADWVLSAGELEYQRMVRKSVCAARDISAGEVIVEADLALKRTDTKDTFYDFAQVVGRTAKSPITANTPIFGAGLL